MEFMAGSEPTDLLEDIEISPWRRWQLYGKWPSRQLSQLGVVLTALLHCFLLSDALATYSQNFERNLVNLIFSGGLQHDDFSRKGGFDLDAEDFHANEFVVFNTSDARSQLIRVVENYFALGKSTVDFIVTADRTDPDNNVPSPLLRLVSAGVNGSDTTLVINAVDDLGPLSPKQSPQAVSWFLHVLKYMELVLVLESENPMQWYLIRDACVLWEYHFTYERENGAGPFFATIKQHSEQRCNRISSLGGSTPILWLQGWLVFSCVLHMGFAFGRVWRGLSVLRVLRNAYGDGYQKPTTVECQQQRCAQSHQDILEQQQQQPDDRQEEQHESASDRGTLPKAKAKARFRTRTRLLSQLQSNSKIRMGKWGNQSDSSDCELETNSSDDERSNRSSASFSSGRNSSSNNKNKCSSSGAELSWNALYLDDKLVIINIWNLISIVGDTMLLAYTFLQLSEVTGHRMLGAFRELDSGWMSSIIKVLLGSGVTAHLLALLEYAEYNLVDYLFIQVNRAARTEIFKILVGCIPFTMAFVVFGTILFGSKVSRFGSMTDTGITLFALCVGDEMLATYKDLQRLDEYGDVPFLITVTYLTSFVCIHLYVVAMSILAVVEEAFISEGLWLLEVSNQKAKRDSVNNGGNGDLIRQISPSQQHESQQHRTSASNGLKQSPHVQEAVSQLSRFNSSITESQGMTSLDDIAVSNAFFDDELNSNGGDISKSKQQPLLRSQMRPMNTVASHDLFRSDGNRTSVNGNNTSAPIFLRSDSNSEGNRSTTITRTPSGVSAVNLRSGVALNVSCNAAQMLQQTSWQGSSREAVQRDAAANHESPTPARVSTKGCKLSGSE